MDERNKVLKRAEKLIKSGDSAVPNSIREKIKGEEDPEIGPSGKKKLENPKMRGVNIGKLSYKERHGDEGKRRAEEIAEKWKKNMSRLARMDKEEVKKIARKGGKATKGISNPPYTRCIDCDARFVCVRAFEEATRRHNHWKQAEEDKRDGKNNKIDKMNPKHWRDFPKEDSRCMYEIEHRKFEKEKVIRDYNAFLSSNPKDLLSKIQEIFHLLEKKTKEEPTYGRLANLFYMLMSLWKAKFGKAPMLEITQENAMNPTIDIKKMMDVIRRDRLKESKSRGVISTEGKTEEHSDEPTDESEEESEPAEQSSEAVAIKEDG